jgi:hypothetical protein
MPTPRGGGLAIVVLVTGAGLWSASEAGFSHALIYHRLRNHHRISRLARRCLIPFDARPFCSAGTRRGGFDLRIGIFQNGHHPVVR